ncbi:MAG: hypothetical protein H0T54_02945 [Geodermatophilaceae bacterium]|nr:hypothetical protein [Geodermatophilaceae bacterium]
MINSGLPRRVGPRALTWDAAAPIIAAPAVLAVWMPSGGGVVEMARIAVTDPEGSQWRVWRRWYAWRRVVTLGDVGRALGEATDDIGFFFVLPLVAIGLVVTLIDLVLQLIALPFILLARVLRLASWPIQLDRANKHIRTLRAKGFGAAGTVRDQAAQAIQAGSLPDVPPLDRPAAATPAQTTPAQAPPAQPTQAPPAQSLPGPPAASQP